MDVELLFLVIFTGFLGLLLGASATWLLHRFKVGSYQRLSQEILQKTNLEAEIRRKNAEIELQDFLQNKRRDLDEEIIREKRRIKEDRSELKEKEEKIERRVSLVEKKIQELDKREALLSLRREKLDVERSEIHQKQKFVLEELEKISGLTSHEARTQLLSKIAHEVEHDAANLTRKVQKEAEEESEKIASKIIATAINRLAVNCVSETTITTVSLPNDEMKGRIIGREGRNIRALERATGVNLLVDDTPGVVVISGFDPIRRQVARHALTELLSDGRIHPTRIEEVVEKGRQTLHKEIKLAGEDAALRIHAHNLHPELIKYLGKLKFRYSYGQNILEHSLEVAHILGIMADELGLDSALARRIGLLHDIGKAASHEIQGTHALIGRDLALKYGEGQEVANGIGCHHDEIEAITIEGSLCSAADAISASRPGARIEAVEEYIKRLKKLEEMAYEFPGISHAYALQAGREVRVVVLPEMIDDDGVVNLARDLTKRIEGDLKYPGKIKVTVIREKRVVEYAL